MIIGPKYKICKRLGSGVFEKCQTQKYMLSENRRSDRRGGRPRAGSDYQRQLLEKQKARFMYGITERQFSRYVKEAIERHKGDAFDAVLARLESRLDNVVYRLGLAKTRRLARQLVSHGHITINGRKVTVPSYDTRAGDAIAVREGSRAKGPFAAFSQPEAISAAPIWLSFDPAKLEGSVTGRPERANTDLYFDLAGVLEFYSR
jgi:small subunit ribosomal protein S4